MSSQATLTHNGGGNSNSIANMVTWTISEYGADSKKVFVTGSSSGAMMTVFPHSFFQPVPSIRINIVAQCILTGKRT